MVPRNNSAAMQPRDQMSMLPEVPGSSLETLKEEMNYHYIISKTSSAALIIKISNKNCHVAIYLPVGK